jgi:hypothetical protein
LRRQSTIIIMGFKIHKGRVAAPELKWKGEERRDVE